MAKGQLMSNLDIVNDCDRLPYYESDPGKYSDLLSTCYKFHLHGSPIVGYMPHWVVEEMPWGEGWLVDHTQKLVSPHTDYDSVESQSRLIRETLERAKERDKFKVLRRWRNELHSVVGMSGEVSMERAGSALFGIITYGAHLTAYVGDGDRMKIWVPRRASNKHTYGGMLDNTVAGGISKGEKPFECLVREAEEEASLPEGVVRKHAKPCGTVSYFLIRDAKAGGETGLLQPECQFVYDLELGADIIPKPNDDEVEDFQLWGVDKVQKAIAEGQFKPNCALVLLDFFIRHGILTPDNEADYAEIVSRLHRKLPFPTS
ncbi:MAG: hypothetical protein Q9191_003763 [Dirinaria sp. TL-2023a]